MKKTLENLTKAFIGESQARNRYDLYAKAARKEGFEQIAAIFLLTAENEKEHAKRLFEHIQDLRQKNKGNPRQIKVEAEAPLVIGNTAVNLQAAAAGERYEHQTMYPEFAAIAQKEKLPQVASRLRSIAIAEKHHEKRYRKLLDEVKNKTVFKKKKPVWWVCRECGYVFFGTQPPQVCPSCDHTRAYYEILCEKY